MGRPDVSVVIPSFQGADRLVGLMECLGAQRTRVDWEVVVVLDGSTDGSRGVLAGWEGSLPLRVLDRSVNCGRSATLNEGFAAAEGRVLVRCDDDLLPAPGYVQRAFDLVADDPTVAAVGLYRNVFPPTAFARVYGRPVDARFRCEAYAAPADRRWMFWAGNCAVHRDMWQRVGPYDAETFRSYGWEDIDWGYRLFRAGGHIVLDPELETTHRVAAVTAAGRLDRAEQSGRARTRFEAKHGVSGPSPSGPWAALVEATSRVAPSVLGRTVDIAVRALPPSTGLTVVDLAVEAAHRRGMREGSA